MSQNVQTAAPGVLEGRTPLERDSVDGTVGRLGRTAEPPKPLGSFTALRALWFREWLASSRLARTPWLIALGSSALGTVVLLRAVAATHTPSSDLGRELFDFVVGLMGLFVTLFGPAIAANSVALEREGKTWEALVMAGISPRTIDRGKFLGAFSHLVVYLLAFVPSLAIPHLFGGVRLSETLLAFVAILLVGALAVRFGLLLSAIVPTARTTLVVTLLASAMLTGVSSIVTVAMGEVLSYGVGMSSVSGHSQTVVAFWPVALTYEPLSGGFVRYLIVAPLGGFLLLWFTLRELTLDALTTAARGAARSHTRKYILLVATGALLGILPRNSTGVLGFEAVLSLFTFVTILTVAGAPAKTRTLGRSLTLIGSGLVAVLVLAGVATLFRRLGWWDGWSSTRAEIPRFLVYAPAFAVFVTGLSAAVRTFLRNGIAARVVPAIVSGVAALVPVIASPFLELVNLNWVLAFSPFGVFSTNPGNAALVGGATAWLLVGAALLALTHVRERALTLNQRSS